MDNEKMGRFIAEQRKAKGLTQLELANKLHITDKAISKWERGLNSPDIGLLSPLADALGISVNDLLNGACTDAPSGTAVTSVNDVLHYAQKSVQKKYSTLKRICAAVFTALLLTALITCSIVDVAITNRFTWSLYPISSILYGGCVLFPVILSGKKGLLRSLILLTVLTVPYLFTLDIISAAGGQITKIGAVASVITFTFLWTVWFIMRRFRNRKLLGAGLSVILSAVVCVLINGSLALLLEPEAAAFDVWDALSVIILLTVGTALILFEFIVRRK